MNAKWFTTLLFFAAPALAHEFWIEPSEFHPEPGDQVELPLRVGEHFVGEPSARKNDRIKTFAYFAPQQETPTPISGNDGADPAGTITIDKKGCYVVGYHNSPSRIELDAKKFEEYLKEEGLGAIVEERKRLGESDRPGREMYSRCAKSLILAGPPTETGLDRRFGFPLELIPRSNPIASKPGRMEFTVQLLHQDKPIEGVQVAATRRGAPDKAVSARTDKEGLVRFRLDEPGLWLISAVHMTRAENTADAEWESLWASLTFEQAAATRE